MPDEARLNVQGLLRKAATRHNLIHLRDRLRPAERDCKLPNRARLPSHPILIIDNQMR